VSLQDTWGEQVRELAEGIHCHKDGPNTGVDVLAGIPHIQVVQHPRLMQVLKVDHVLQRTGGGNKGGFQNSARM
jgi:hypothetical protein